MIFGIAHNLFHSGTQRENRLDLTSVHISRRYRTMKLETPLPIIVRWQHQSIYFNSAIRVIRLGMFSQFFQLAAEKCVNVP